MNLYLFNANDSAATYGIGTYLGELSQALAGAEIKIYIVHLHSVRPEFAVRRASASLTGQGSPADNVEHWYVPEVRNLNTFSGSIQKVEAYYRNVTYLLRLHIKDIKNLVFHFNYNQCQFLVKELNAAFDCKTVVTVHFMKWSLALNGSLARMQAIKKKTESQRSTFEQLLYDTGEYECLLYKETEHIIALSQYMKTFLCSEYLLDPEKVTVIPNGLEDINPSFKTDKGALRKKWHISEKELIILFVGRLHFAKGLLFLIRSFRKVLNHIPDCRLLIVGGGQYDAFIQEAKDISTKVTFTGLLEKKDLCDIYQIADAGVTPSLFETFGYVAAEMMMHGIPMITTSASGLGELTEDGISSLQVPVIAHPEHTEIDTDLLAEKMLFLLQNPEERKRLGVNARKRYEDNYSSEIFRKNMLNFYNSLL